MHMTISCVLDWAKNKETEHMEVWNSLATRVNNNIFLNHYIIHKHLLNSWSWLQFSVRIHAKNVEDYIVITGQSSLWTKQLCKNIYKFLLIRRGGLLICFFLGWILAYMLTFRSNIFWMTTQLFETIMFFCKAKHSELVSLKKCLEKYCSWFGQLISIEISGVFPSKWVSINFLRQVKCCWGLDSLPQSTTYLGVPLFLSKNRSNDLKLVKERLESKLSSWKGMGRESNSN